jgi:hypothetical protein
MTAFFEIAYATASERLCLFTGTGFSKAVTAGTAPGWEGLLRSVCEGLPDADALAKSLFDSDPKNRLTLPEAAQIIAIERDKNALTDIHVAVANLIGSLSPSGDNSAISSFLAGKRIDVVTTNYDKLMEALVTDTNDCCSIAPGLPVPQTKAHIRICHVHGSIDSPPQMVVTSDDYFSFMNNESYFSRKLSTVLYEDTVVILGYSLGDSNLQTILSEYRGSSHDYTIGGSIFFVSRDPVDQHVKDYFEYCYGIRVLDSLEIPDFFKKVSDSMPEAIAILDQSQAAVRKVLDEGKHYLDSYISLRSSFSQIVAAVKAAGRSVNDPKLVTALGDVLSKKMELTAETGAWQQYDHLAEWLVYLGSVIDLNNSPIKDTFLQAVYYSMTTMSKKSSLGYSWQSYKTWAGQWFKMKAANRSLIKAYMEAHAPYNPDVMEVVRQG